jgi:hypothetical protein
MEKINSKRMAQLISRSSGTLLRLFVLGLLLSSVGSGPAVQAHSPLPSPTPNSQIRRDPISGVPLPPPPSPLERRDPYSGLPLPGPLGPLERRDPFSGVPLDPGHPNYSPGRDHIHGNEGFDERGRKPKHHGDEHRRYEGFGEESRERQSHEQDRSPGFP